MVSSPHEAMHRIFREEPALFARLLPRAGIDFPEYHSIEPLDTDLSEIRPMERRVDSAFRVQVADDEGGFLLAVESQSKPDTDKRNSWTYYLAHMYAKYGLPPVLVVLCRDKATASWAAEPIRVGRPFHTSMLVFPLVLGPGNLSVITDPDEAAEDVPLAVFSAFAHAKDPGLPAIREALAEVLAGQDEGSDDWVEYVEIGLGDGPARDLWRQLMAVYTPKFPDSIVAEYWNKGRANGRAEDILRLLDRRGIEIPDAVRERVKDCTDLDVLSVWFDRSLTVASAEELFVEE
ncbi:RpnC/YadD family protein [Streptomyces canus]|uniref:hypothetical protein n=1 Tax=Streptomyces canus TaxID=58343 RepID=UPI00074A4366|nr:hypothetical protein [Streptomyces canus]KUN11780.1 hypothetical protein AQI96_18815 [Streptomyces canus]